MNRTHKLLFKSFIFFLFLTIVLYPVSFFLLDVNDNMKYIIPLLISITLSAVISIVFFFILESKTPEESLLP